MAEKTIEQVLKEHTQQWMSIPGVVGTAIGNCEGVICIRVLLIRESPELRDRIPSTVDGYRVELQVTGPIEAREESDTHQTHS